ncbi:MAG: GspH/FimT family pseudopilin [Granulosicoccus sp.]
MPPHTGQLKSSLSGGFSLIEILIALSIVVILAGFAVSGFSSWLARVKVEEVVDNLQQSLFHARSETIKHGGRIYLCGSVDRSTCGSTFDRGWLVFHDVDSSQQLDNGENLISTISVDGAGFQVAVTNADDGQPVNGISYNYRGYSTVPIAVTVSRYQNSESFTINRSGHID